MKSILYGTIGIVGMIGLDVIYVLALLSNLVYCIMTLNVGILVKGYEIGREQWEYKLSKIKRLKSSQKQSVIKQKLSC